MNHIEPTKLKWIGYCRKSSDREDKQTLSIDAQKRELQALAQGEDIEFVNLLTESKTAYKTGRPEFNKMLQLIEEGEVNSIVVYHLSRLARNTADGGRIIYLMDEGKLKRIYTPTKTYENNSDDKFFLQIEFGMTKKSSDDTSTFVKRDIQSKLLKGEFPAWAPIGYLNMDRNGRIAGKLFDTKKQVMLEQSGRMLKRIELDPILAPKMREFFEEALKGNRNLRELSDFAFSLGIRSQRLQKKQGISQINAILTNPFYYSKILLKGQLYHGVHDRIITETEFNEIQTILHDRSKPRAKRMNFAFRGQIRCGVCGLCMVGYTKIKPSGKSYTYYMCSKRRGNCGQRGITLKNLEDQIEIKLNEVAINDRLWRLCLELLKESYGGQIEAQTKQVKVWENQKRVLEMKLKRLLDLRIDGAVSDEEYQSKKGDLSAEKQELNNLIANAQANNSGWLKKAEEFFNDAHSVYETFKNGSPEEKRIAVAKFGFNLTLKDGLLSWEFKKPFNFLVERSSETDYSVGTQDRAVLATQNANFASQVNFWRVRRDLNPRSSP